MAFSHAEVWKNIEGYEGEYMVSNTGKVMSLKSNKILKPQKMKHGYLEVYLCKNGKKKHQYIHRLVANAFIPNSDNKMFINHIDFDRTNDSVDNLEWVSPKENTLHSIKNMRRGGIGELYIAYEKSRNKYKVQINRKNCGRFKTLKEAIEHRDLLLANM